MFCSAVTFQNLDGKPELLKNKVFNLNTVVHVYNSSPGEAKAGESEVKGQPGLSNEIERKRE